MPAGSGGRVAGGPDGAGWRRSIVVTTVCAVASITETVPLPVFAVYRNGDATPPPGIALVIALVKAMASGRGATPANAGSGRRKNVVLVAGSMKATALPARSAANTRPCPPTVPAATSTGSCTTGVAVAVGVAVRNTVDVGVGVGVGVQGSCSTGPTTGTTAGGAVGGTAVRPGGVFVGVGVEVAVAVVVGVGVSVIGVAVAVPVAVGVAVATGGAGGGVKQGMLKNSAGVAVMMTGPPGGSSPGGGNSGGGGGGGGWGSGGPKRTLIWPASAAACCAASGSLTCCCACWSCCSLRPAARTGPGTSFSTASTSSPPRTRRQSPWLQTSTIPLPEGVL